MKSNKYIVFGILVILIIGTYIFFLSSRSPVAPDASGTTFLTKQDTTTPEITSRYLTYSQTAFAAASDKKRVLFFHAPWCPTCRPADAAFQKDSVLIPESVILFKTDYDTSTELKKKYGVTYQHTFVQIDGQGNEVTKWNGGQLTELTANIK